MTKTHSRLTFCCFVISIALALSACTPKETQTLLEPTEVLGKVLADETATIAGAKKKIVLISPDASWGPTSTAEKAFKSALAKRGYSIVNNKSANLGDPMKSGQVGLKAADYMEVLQNSADVGAIVSFAGAPLLTAADPGRLPAERPPLLVVATVMLGNVPGVANDRTLLANMISARLIQMAIVNGSEAAPQASGKPNADRELFGHHFQILRSSPATSP